MSTVDPVLSLIRPEILALTPYSSARKESSGGRIWLDANENPKTPSAFSPFVALAKEGSDRQFNRYPDPQPADLVATLVSMGAKVHEVRAGRISLEQRFLGLVARDRAAAGTPSAQWLR